MSTLVGRIASVLPEGLHGRKLLFFCLYMGIITAFLPANVEGGHRVVYLLYAAFLFWILWPMLAAAPEVPAAHEPSWAHRHLFSGLLLVSILSVVLTRLYPFWRYGSAPLGYDTGFYIQYFLLVTGAGHIGNAIGSHLAYTPWFPLSLLGLRPLTTINIFHLFHQLALLGSLYALARSLPARIQSLPLVAAMVFLFASSINQYMAFWWMFYKQTMALPMLVGATALYLKRSWLAVPLAGIAASVHLQSSIPFAGALFLSLLVHAALCLYRRKPIDRELAIIAGSGLFVGLLLLLLKGTQELSGYVTYVRDLGGFASNAQSWEVANAKGLFIPFETFRLNLLFPLPFAVIGALRSPSWLLTDERRVRMMLLPSLLLVSLMLGAFQFIYQNRSLIILDLAVLIFACYPLACFFQRFSSDRVSTAALGVLCAAATLSTVLVVGNHPPQLYPDERAELAAMSSRIRSGDYAMATDSIYTPWVFAFSNFKNTIAPGWLFWDKWTLHMWEEFWYGPKDERRHAMLSLYGPGDIYMFFGNRQIKPPELQRFIHHDPHMTQVSPHVWKYSQSAAPLLPQPAL